MEVHTNALRSIRQCLLFVFESTDACAGKSPVVVGAVSVERAVVGPFCTFIDVRTGGSISSVT